jgi:hypothetical protein
MKASSDMNLMEVDTTAQQFLGRTPAGETGGFGLQQQ